MDSASRHCSAETLAVSYWVVFKGCMSSFHVFWPIVENPRRLWHLEQNLKAIMDFEGIVVQEEEGFWPKEEQGGRVLRFGDTESMFSGKVSDHSCYFDVYTNLGFMKPIWRIDGVLCCYTKVSTLVIG